MFDKGILTISIDYEFAWGYADYQLSDKDKLRIGQEVSVVEKLIALFERYDIPVLWAIVGELLNKDNKKEIIWQDNGLVDKIRNSKINHEIGSHSFGHIIFNHATAEQAEADLAKALEIHKKNNLEFKSFIFPRNQIAHLELLKKYGLSVYRGTINRPRSPKPIGRILNIARYFSKREFTHLPSLDVTGMVNIPESLLFLGRNGLRKIISPQIMVKKIRRGIKQAIERKEIYHLWFHPSNFSYNTDIQFNILEDILRFAQEQKQKDRLDIKTLKQIIS